ncbi:MAG: hypothetical protein ACTSU6_05330 [Candidatus Njordarchaeales archaeon]
MIIEGQLIVSPGEYYGISLTEDKIKEHIRLTDWTDRYNTSLIYGHKTNTKDKWLGNPSPDMWAGHYSPPKFLSLSDGVSVAGAYSDIYIYDEDLARKLAYGKLKCGVSATFDLRNYGIKNLSIVDNPMDKQAYLNLADDGGRIDLDEVEIVSPKYLNLSDSPTIERGHDSKKNTMSEEKNPTEKELALQKEVEGLKGELEAAKKPEADQPKAIVDTQPKEQPKVEPTVDKPIEAVVDTPKVDEPAKDAPVEKMVTLEADKKDDSSQVVDAISKMSDTMSEELKKIANPQSVAPTTNQAIPSRDDEVTQKLVDKYKELHD